MRSTCAAKPISIHSLRVEGDGVFAYIAHAGDEFQSTPSVWRETVIRDAHVTEAIFQSTPSVWRETYWTDDALVAKEHFNPLPPCGGRHFWRNGERDTVHFNPLPPCGGRQTRAKATAVNYAFQSTPSVWRETAFHHLKSIRQLFQSTPSVWRETIPCVVADDLTSISIHSLRVEGDAVNTSYAK